MTTIQIGDKKLIIEDGCNVEVGADEVRVKPALPAIQWIQPLPVFLPQVPNPPYVPNYPIPQYWPNTGTWTPTCPGTTWTSPAQTGNYN